MKFLFILLTFLTLSANAQTSSKTLGGNYPSGFYGFRNYMLNPGGEIDAQNVSVAGTNGTIGVFSNNPITNKKSFRVGGDLNTNITGTFTAAPFDQGLGDSANNCAAAFNLQPNGVGTYTMNVKLGSTTVATRSFTTTSGIPVQFQTFLFSCGAFGLTPTIDIIANLTSGSGTDHYQADDFYMGQDPGLVQSLRIATNRTSYIPVFTGFGTVVNIECYEWLDGAFGYIDCKATAGTPTAVEARVSLPTSWPATATFTQGIRAASSTLAAFNVNAARVVFPLIESATAYVTFGNQTSGTAGLTKLLGTTLVGTGDTISFSARIPLSGTSNVIGVPASCINNPDCANNFSAKVSSAGVVSDENLSFINGNAVNASSVYTITWDTSRFSVAPNCTVTNSDGSSGVNRINTISASNIVVVTSNSSFTAADRGFIIQCSRAGTDVKPWGPIPWLTGMASVDATSSIRQARAFIASTGVVTYLSGVTPWLTSCGSTNTKSCTFLNTPATTPQCLVATLGTSSASSTNIQTLNSTTIQFNGFITNTAAASNVDLTVDCWWPR